MVFLNLNLVVCLPYTFTFDCVWALADLQMFHVPLKKLDIKENEKVKTVMWNYSFILPG